jgi:hypothetical protein
VITTASNLISNLALGVSFHYQHQGCVHSASDHGDYLMKSRGTLRHRYTHGKAPRLSFVVVDVMIQCCWLVAIATKGPYTVATLELQSVETITEITNQLRSGTKRGALHFSRRRSRVPTVFSCSKSQDLTWWRLSGRLDFGQYHTKRDEFGLTRSCVVRLKKKKARPVNR